MNEKEMHLWEVHKLACEWVRFADSKASVILTAEGVMASLTIPSVMPQAKFILDHWEIALPAVLSMVATLASCAYCISAIMPRLKVNVPESNIYFGHIATKYPDSTSFSTAFRPILDDPELLKLELTSQIWANCSVALKKYNDTKSALMFLSLALILAIISASANLVIDINLSKH